MMKKILMSFALGGLPFVCSAGIPVEWNGKYYQYIQAQGILWEDANAAANASVHNGLAGHLATLTSAEENAFVATLVDGIVSYPGDPNLDDVLSAWVGGFQSPGDEMDPFANWRWVNGEGPIESVNGGLTFANWFAGEPNDWLGVGSEQHMSIWGNTGYGNTVGSWNDEGGLWNISGYVVEFERASGVPDVGSTAGLLGMAMLGLAWARARRE